MTPAQLLIFVDSNLGTHFVTPVSQDATIGNLKGQLEREHTCCFPNFGEIRVYALMIKQNSCHYHLPDSLLIKNAFEGFEGPWFLRMDATHIKCLNSHAEPMANITTVGEGNPLDNHAFVKTGADIEMQKEHGTPGKSHTELVCNEKNIVRRRKNQSMSFEDTVAELLKPICTETKEKKKRENTQESSKYIVEEAKVVVHKEEREPFSRGETPVISSSSVLPVSGIIARYFPKSDDGKMEDIQSGRKIVDIEFSEQSTEGQRQMLGKWEVGKRILLAKRNLSSASEMFPLRKKKRTNTSNIHRLLMAQKVSHSLSQICLLEETDSS